MLCDVYDYIALEMLTRKNRAEQARRNWEEKSCIAYRISCLAWKGRYSSLNAYIRIACRKKTNNSSSAYEEYSRHTNQRECEQEYELSAHARAHTHTDTSFDRRENDNTATERTEKKSNDMKERRRINSSNPTKCIGRCTRARVCVCVYECLSRV